jgi:hypothetical protein
MEICHTHNLNRDLTVPKPYGIRVTLPRQDTFATLLGTDWERLYWYPTAEERDRALRDMSSEHLYSRRGDRPKLDFERVERSVSAELARNPR